jgi:diamine N-acetyltransferase
MNTLVGKNIRLRAPEPEDLDLLFLWENDPEIWSVSNTLTPFSRFILKSYIEASHLDIFEAKQLRLMIDVVDPTFTIGTVDLFDFDPYNQRAGIGILIGDASQKRKGYANEALDLLIHYCFSMLDFKQLYCNISSGNTNSIQLFQKKGFIQCGEKKEWLKTPAGWESELMFQLIRNK